MQKGIIGEDFNVLLYTLLCCFNSSMSMYYLFFFFSIFLAEPHGMWDVIFPTGLNHWTAREVLSTYYFYN